MIVETVLAISLWCWNPVAGADGYRFYWSNVSDGWRECDREEVLAPEVCIPYPVVPDPPPGGIVYFNVTAFNEHGESEEEHGPVSPCP